MNRYVGASGSASKTRGQAVLGGVGLAGHAVGADVVRLEEGPEAVVVLLGDRVVLVVVAAGAVERQAEERLGRVLDRVCEPDVAVELVPVADEEAGRPQAPSGRPGAASSAASISTTIRS